MTIRLTDAAMPRILYAWLAATVLLIGLAQIAHIWPLLALLFVSLLLLPGTSLIYAGKIRSRSRLELLLFSVGLSLLVIMISGLLTNQLFQAVGTARVLTLWHLLPVFTVVVAAIIVFGQRRTSGAREEITLRLRKPHATTVVLGLATSLLPVVAAFGAFRLNNGGNALFAMIAISATTAVFVGVLLLRRRTSDAAIAWSVFCAALALLLMTSLRSWDISGHDIAREFHVYSLTNLLGRWDIAAFRDPYNACLSITILPEVFAKFMDLSGLVVFKLLLQIICALCPVGLYVLLRRYSSKLGALVGVALFLSYPTFINDSAMLTRQGVAFLFFVLALLAMLRAGHLPRRGLFLVFGLGVVLSHYSTSYMFVAVMVIALAAKIIVTLCRRKPMLWHGNKQSVITPSIIFIMVLATFLWYAQVTATSDGLTITVRNAIVNVPNLLSDDNKSSDTSVALFLSSSKTQADIYESYFTQASHNDPAAMLRYLPNLTSDDLPVTPLGAWLENKGLDPDITATARQHFARVLQLLAVVSVAYVTWRWIKRDSTVSSDLVLLSLAGVAVTICMVVLPNLSMNYGLLRTFQQMLIFLSIPIVLLLAAASHRVRPHWRTAIAAGGVTGLFLLFTGFFAQLLGGVSPSFTLNNSGLYYGLYYTTRADLVTLQWMKQDIPKAAEVRSANVLKATMHDPYYPFDETGILPMQRPVGGYVFLSQAQLIAGKFYVYHEGSPLITSFPLEYYQDSTNKIYSTPSTGVFH